MEMSRNLHLEDRSQMKQCSDGHPRPTGRHAACKTTVSVPALPGVDNRFIDVRHVKTGECKKEIGGIVATTPSSREARSSTPQLPKIVYD